MTNGVPTVCVPNPLTHQCVKPYLDHQDLNGGGPHQQINAPADIDGGRLDGFIKEAVGGRKNCADVTNPACTNGTTGRATDVMGYHASTDIPNYWAYAKNFVLQDHMFEPVASWSFPQHLAMVSGWSAACGNPNNPKSCYSDLGQAGPANLPQRTTTNPTPFGWTDITYLLNKHKVGWAYYLDHGSQVKGQGRPVSRTSGIHCPASSTCIRTTRRAMCRTLHTSTRRPRRAHFRRSRGSRPSPRTVSTRRRW